MRASQARYCPLSPVKCDSKATLRSPKTLAPRASGRIWSVGHIIFSASGTCILIAVNIIIDNQNLMMTNFKAAMAKMQVLGQNKALLTDCSDVRGILPL